MCVKRKYQLQFFFDHWRVISRDALNFISKFTNQHTHNRVFFQFERLDLLGRSPATKLTMDRIRPLICSLFQFFIASWTQLFCGIVFSCLFTLWGFEDVLLLDAHARVLPWLLLSFYQMGFCFYYSSIDDNENGDLF